MVIASTDEEGRARCREVGKEAREGDVATFLLLWDGVLADGGRGCDARCLSRVGASEALSV